MHALFDFNVDEMLALAFGTGPLSDHHGNIYADIVNSIKRRWDAVPPMDDYDRMTWAAMNIIRSRARKTMRLFANEYNISEMQLYPVLYNVIKMSERGRGRYREAYGWEGVNDIYSFFRMFRTFENKRTRPCKGGYQHNILYMSHISHSLKIMYMMKALFGIAQPSYSESIDDLVNRPGGSGGTVLAWKEATDNLSTAVQEWGLKVEPKVTFERFVQRVIKPLGNTAQASLFFA